MIRRIFIILAIIALVGALLWDTYGKEFVIVSIFFLLATISLSLLRGCGGEWAAWLLDNLKEKQ